MADLIVDFNEFSSNYKLKSVETNVTEDDPRVEEVLKKFSNGYCSFHKFTASIDYQKIRDNRKNFSSLLIDKTIKDILVKNKIINSNERLTNLYPLQTLCHAIMLSLIGFHDTSNLLREMLKRYLNSDHQHELKKRFMIYHKYMDDILKVQTEQKHLEDEWQEAQKMMRPVGKDAKNESIYAPLYLQDIHVFAISNLLRRPIVVLGIPVVRNVTPSFIRGIYLPLLNNADECVKEPIIIAFHDFHFCPLVYVMNNCDILHNSLSCGVLGDVFNAEENITEIFGGERTNSSGMKKTHNYIPLVYSNLESMKIHFLKTEEEKKAPELLENYFKTGFAKVSEGNENEEPLYVIAVKCFTNIPFKNNSIDKYCDHINESSKLSKTKIRQEKNTNV